MKIHKSLKQFLGIILFLASGNSYIYAQDKTEAPENSDIKAGAPARVNREAVLMQSSSWRKVKVSWDSMLNITNNSIIIENKNNKNKASKQAFEVLREKYAKEAEDFSYHLRVLYRKNLISEEEKQFLSELYYQRYDTFIPRAYFTCYLAASDAYSPMMDLGQRLEILKKLLKENKINQETYDKTINKIKKDLQLINFRKAYGSLLIKHYNKYLQDTYKANIKDNSVSYDNFIKNNPDKIMTYNEYIQTKFPEEVADDNINLLIYLMK